MEECRRQAACTHYQAIQEKTSACGEVGGSEAGAGGTYLVVPRAEVSARVLAERGAREGGLHRVAVDQAELAPHDDAPCKAAETGKGRSRSSGGRWDRSHNDSGDYTSRGCREVRDDGRRGGGGDGPVDSLDFCTLKEESAKENEVLLRHRIRGKMRSRSRSTGWSCRPAVPVTPKVCRRKMKERYACADGWRSRRVP